MKLFVGLAAMLAIVLLAAAGPLAEEAKETAKSGEATDTKQSEQTSKRARAQAKKLERITVVGSPGRANEIPGSVFRISQEQLDAQNQGVDDIHRVLFRIPGINITEEEGYGLRPNIGMRGTGTERSANITLMEDGVLIAPAPYSAPAAYYFPTVGRMQGVEIRKGSSQIKYGPRTNGGALNLLSTSPPDDLAGRLKMSFGENNTNRVHLNVGNAWKNLSWLVEGYNLNSDGFKEMDGGGDTGFELRDYLGKARIQSSDDASIYQEATLKLGYVEQDANETYLGLTEEDFDESPYRRYRGSQLDHFDSEHKQAQLRYFAMPTDKVDVTATAYRNEFQRNWYKLDSVEGTGIADILEDPVTHAAEYEIVTGGDSGDDALAVKANNRDYYAHGIEGILGLNFEAASARHDLEVGARLHADEEDRFQHSDKFRMDGGTMVLTDPGVPGLSGGGNNRVNSARAVAVYAQDKMQWGRMNVEAGARFEHIETERKQYAAGDPGRDGDPTISEQTTDVVVPGIGASFQTSDRTGVFAGIHRGFGPPGPGADAETKPETSVNYEAGVRYADNRVSGQVLGYFNDYENLIGKDTFASGGTGSGDLFNGGAVEIFGIEASLNSDLLSFVASGASLAIPVGVSYTYTHGQFKSSFVSDYDPWGSVEAGDELPYLSEHQLGLSVGLEGLRWGVGLFGNYMSEMRTQAGQGDAAPNELIDARFIIDGNAEYGLTQRVRAFVSVQNMTDKAYVAARRPAGLRPGMPRQIVLGLKLGI